MYYLCMITFIGIVTLSCKDDDDVAPVHEPLLSKIVRNEVTLMDFEYADRKLIRMNLYATDGDLAHYTEYEYDDEGIVEAIQYDGEDDAMESRVVFTHSKAGQITKAESYAKDTDFEEVQFIITYSYNPSGQVESTEIAALDKQVFQLEEFTYDDAGHREQLTRTFYPGDPEEYEAYEMEYTPGDKLIPDHWNDYEFLLMTFNMDGFLLDMFNVSSHRTTWTEDGKINSEIRTDASNQQFNDDGYLVSQTLKRISLKGLSPQQTDEMTYEYTE
jgi:hypothetical protein